ncbi:MAG: 2Fe-2S iron-sulfur cluster binding domain-containing protein [Treponema sp.]|nr:2Fe-2S iron-sulfur cluster binding domain-containing protein [Treponema sp.]
MKILLTLNGKNTTLETDGNESLLHLLRRENIYSVKCGCEKGLCGNCMVLYNGLPVPSCRITAPLLKNSKIETLEGLKTNPIYQDIITGFNQAGVHLCGWCNAGKILTAFSLVSKKHRPDIEEISTALRSIEPCCTDRNTLANGILYAIAANHAREGRQNAKK